jgi:hypothetical protein
MVASSPLVCLVAIFRTGSERSHTLIYCTHQHRSAARPPVKCAVEQAFIAMFSWLPGIAGPPRKKQLQELIDKLLSQGDSSGGGDQPFGLKEKELKRLCTSAR